MHAIVGIDTDQVGVEGCVMDLRQRQAIGHNGLSQLLVGVRNDVCGVDQPFLRQSGKRTPASISYFNYPVNRIRLDVGFELRCIAK